MALDSRLTPGACGTPQPAQPSTGTMQASCWLATCCEAVRHRGQNRSLSHGRPLQLLVTEHQLTMVTQELSIHPSAPPQPKCSAISSAYVCGLTLPSHG